MQHFTTYLKNPGNSADELFRIAVTGIGKFAAVFNKFINSNDLDVIFWSILQRTENIR